MKKIAMIKGGAVQNIAIWDGLSAWLPGEDWILVDVTDNDIVGIGWSYDGLVFSPKDAIEQP